MGAGVHDVRRVVYGFRGGAVGQRSDGRPNRWGDDFECRVQAHTIHAFRPGLWVATSAGYGVGGQTSVNGIKYNNRKENIAWAISAGNPITRWLSFKAADIGTLRQAFVGADTDTLTIGLA